MEDKYYYYTPTHMGYEIDWRQMRFKDRLKIMLCLILNKKIEIRGKNKFVKSEDSVAEEKGK